MYKQKSVTVFIKHYATSLQDCRNSKFVIFQEKHLKVYKSHKLNRITHLELNRITQ